MRTLEFRQGDIPVAISYSMGASSEWLVRAMLRGILPRPEHVCVVSADTGAEHDWSYMARGEVQMACAEAGVPFIGCAADTSLETDMLALGADNAPTRADHPPFFIDKAGGRGRAQHRCTRYYKVAPMRRAVSTWLASIGQDKAVEKWIGFSADETHRAQKALAKQDVEWERLRFPAIELGLDRGRLRADLHAWTGRAPMFSMCVFCPWKSPRRWMETGGADLARAVAVDEAIRDLDCVGLTDGPAYLTDRLIPVADLGDPQPNLPGLESYCDEGACFL